MMPWYAGGTWDSWSGNNCDGNEGLYYLGQEIGWLQKQIPLPTVSVDSTLSYTIGVAAPPSQSLLANPDFNQGTIDYQYQDAIDFIRAVERSDPYADTNGDGVITQEDFKAFKQKD